MTSYMSKSLYNALYALYNNCICPLVALTCFSKHAAYKQSICVKCHYNDVIMGAMPSQITSLTIVNSTLYSGADQRKH